MNTAELEALIQSITALRSDLEFSNKLIHLQAAKIRALEVFVTSQIDAGTPAKTRAEAWERLGTLLKLCYDEVMAELERATPGAAARLDVRSTMSPEEQDAWYLAKDERKPFSKTGLEPQEDKEPPGPADSEG